MTTGEHLDQAEAYARSLSVEITAAREQEVSLATMMADQGQAMRCVIYHCAAAITNAIVDHTKATKR
jgi:hypothetical protein